MAEYVPLVLADQLKATVSQVVEQQYSLLAEGFQQLARKGRMYGCVLFPCSGKEYTNNQKQFDFVFSGKSWCVAGAPWKMLKKRLAKERICVVTKYPHYQRKEFIGWIVEFSWEKRSCNVM